MSWKKLFFLVAASAVAGVTANVVYDLVGGPGLAQKIKTKISGDDIPSI